MIIGSGLMAKAFKSYKNDKNVLIFASGVSNSTETDSQEFNREFELLKNAIESNKNVIFVYFSTVSIEDESVNQRSYVQHKIALENYIKENAERYLICRVSNVVGKNGNPHTIMNYFVNAIKNNIKIAIWTQAERNLIDVDDVKFIVDELLKKNKINQTINIAINKSILVQDIVAQIEKYFDKKGNFHSIKKGNSLDIDTFEIKDELKLIESKKGKGINYIDSLLKKYYNL